MKILLAVDGSRYSEAAASLIQALDIGSRGEVAIVTVIPEHVFLESLPIQDEPEEGMDF